MTQDASHISKLENEVVALKEQLLEFGTCSGNNVDDSLTVAADGASNLPKNFEAASNSAPLITTPSTTAPGATAASATSLGATAASATFPDARFTSFTGGVDDLKNFEPGDDTTYTSDTDISLDEEVEAPSFAPVGSMYTFKAIAIMPTPKTDFIVKEAMIDKEKILTILFVSCLWKQD